MGIIPSTLEFFGEFVELLKVILHSTHTLHSHILVLSSLGMNSSMFANCSLFCDVRHVRSLVLGQNVMLGKFDVRTFNVWSVQSSVYWCLFQN